MFKVVTAEGSAVVASIRLVRNGNVILIVRRARPEQVTRLRMSKACKETSGDRLVIDELVANAKCGLRNISE